MYNFNPNLRVTTNKLYFSLLGNYFYLKTWFVVLSMNISSCTQLYPKALLSSTLYGKLRPKMLESFPKTDEELLDIMVK